MLNIEKLKQQKSDLQKSYAEARKTSIEMDSKMQSRFDTQKEEWARRAEIIEHLISETQKQIDYLQNLPMPAQNDFVEIGHVVILKEKDDVFRLLVVEGVGGGIKIDDVQLVSVDAPIGRAVLGRMVGEKLIVASQDKEIELSILSIELIH